MDQGSRGLAGPALLVLAALLGGGVGGCADGVPPEIEGVSLLPDTHDPVGPYAVEALVRDDRGLDQVQLLWCERRVDAPLECKKKVERYVTVVMENLGRDHFRGVIPGQPHGHVVEYYVLAIDTSGNQTAVPPEAPVNEVYDFQIVPF